MNDEKKYIERAALALGQPIQPYQRTMIEALEAEAPVNVTGFARVEKIMVGRDENGQPEYMDHYSLNGKL